MIRTIPALLILGGVVAFCAMLALCSIVARADAAMVKFKLIEPDPTDASRVGECMKGAEAWDGRSIGRRGERGPMQFLPATWSDFSDHPVSWAEGRTRAQRAEAARVEANYLLWLMCRCKDLGRRPTAYMMGLIHNTGFENVRRGRILARNRDFAQRVDNLYHDADSR